MDPPESPHAGQAARGRNECGDGLPDVLGSIACGTFEPRQRKLVQQPAALLGTRGCGLDGLAKQLPGLLLMPGKVALPDVNRRQGSIPEQAGVAGLEDQSPLIGLGRAVESANGIKPLASRAVSRIASSMASSRHCRMACDTRVQSFRRAILAKATWRSLPCSSRYSSPARNRFGNCRWGGSSPTLSGESSAPNSFSTEAIYRSREGRSKGLAGSPNLTAQPARTSRPESTAIATERRGGRHGKPCQRGDTFWGRCVAGIGVVPAGLPDGPPACGDCVTSRIACRRPCRRELRVRRRREKTRSRRQPPTDRQAAGAAGSIDRCGLTTMSSAGADLPVNAELGVSSPPVFSADPNRHGGPFTGTPLAAWGHEKTGITPSYWRSILKV